MVRGWIKDYRQELASDIWAMPPLYHRVWQWLKYKANHADKQVPMRDGSKLLIKKGQCFTSYRSVAIGVSWEEHGVLRVPDPRTIKRICDWLVVQGMIQMEHHNSHSRGTLVTLCNYCIYQSEDDENVTANVPAKQQQMSPNKNDKNDNSIIILHPDEAEFLGVLGTVANYPLDCEKDLALYRNMCARYPLIDPIEAIRTWAVYKQDKPLASTSIPRSQINTAFQQYTKWGKCLKKDKKGVTPDANNPDDYYRETEELAERQRRRGSV